MTTIELEFEDLDLQVGVKGPTYAFDCMCVTAIVSMPDGEIYDLKVRGTKYGGGECEWRDLPWAINASLIDQIEKSGRIAEAQQTWLEDRASMRADRIIDERKHALA